MSRAFGKVILLGEHAVVYGRPALAAGLEKGVRSTVTSAKEAELVIDAWDARVTPTDETPLGQAFRAVLDLYEAPTEARIMLDVEIPAGAGLGCSAALGIATLGALDEWHTRTRTEGQLAEAGMVWERVFHGNPSGVDNTVAAFGGVLVFKKGSPPVKQRLRRPLTLAIAHTGVASSTKSMVESVAKQREKTPDRVDKVFDGIESVVRNGALALEHGDFKGLGQLADMNQHLLSALLLSTPKIEELCRAARDAGAHGAKLTGAGGGGCVLAIVDDESKHRVVSAMGEVASEAFLTEVN